ncbi:MAG: hypothetical protein WCX31_15860 [Salinivirgaceae bacterium]
MKELSKGEKIEHAKRLEEYVNFLNKEFLTADSNFKLKHVGYGVPIDKANFYFDFPYNEEADKINDLINKNEDIIKMNKEIHEAFSKNQRKEKPTIGYVYYNYKWLNDHQFVIYDTHNNLDLEDSELKLKWYLTLIHSSIKLIPLSTSYTVEIDKIPASSSSELLVIVKNIESALGQEALLINSFLRENNYDYLKIPKLNEIIVFLNNKVIYLLEKYFDSPVLQKILVERRESEILSYQHSISNLRLVNHMTLLGLYIKNKDLIGISDSYRLLLKKMKVLRMMLYSIFQVEHLKKKENGQDNRKNELYELAGKSVFEILDYFDKEVNLLGIKTNFNYTQEAKDIDFKPPINYAPDKACDLFNCQMVLWNLWTNACHVTNALKMREININAYVSNEKLCLNFINNGEMPERYQKYLNGETNVYPGEKLDYKPYRGIQIVKDICFAKDNKLGINVQVNTNPKPHTIIKLTFNK